MYVVFSVSTRYSFQIVMELEFSRQTFEKYSDIKWNENTSSWSRVVSCRRTDKMVGRQKWRSQ